MSAEDMRNELEAFVNQGLENGWCGWPTKGQRPDRQGSTGICQPRVAGLGRSVLPRDWWLPRLAPVQPFQTSGGQEVRPYGEFLAARRFGGDDRLQSYFG